MKPQEILENFLPDYYSNDNIARIDDLTKFILDEMEDKDIIAYGLEKTTKAEAYRELYELESELLSIAVQNMHDKVCEQQRENCIVAFENSFGDKDSVEKISNAEQPKIKELGKQVVAIVAEQKNNELNFMDWNKPLTEGQQRALYKELGEAGFEVISEWAMQNGISELKGKNVYHFLNDRDHKKKLIFENQTPALVAVKDRLEKGIKQLEEFKEILISSDYIARFGYDNDQIGFAEALDAVNQATSPQEVSDNLNKAFGYGEEHQGNFVDAEDLQKYIAQAKENVETKKQVAESNKVAFEQFRNFEFPNFEGLTFSGVRDGVRKDGVHDTQSNYLFAEWTADNGSRLGAYCYEWEKPNQDTNRFQVGVYDKDNQYKMLNAGIDINNVFFSGYLQDYVNDMNQTVSLAMETQTQKKNTIKVGDKSLTDKQVKDVMSGKKVIVSDISINGEKFRARVFIKDGRIRKQFASATLKQGQKQSAVTVTKPKTALPNSKKPFNKKKKGGMRI